MTTSNTCVLCLAEDDLSDFLIHIHPKPGDIIAIVEPSQCERYGLNCCPYIENTSINSKGE